ncbi:8850_t:CDS:1, partial [Ambispora leptoticha]
VEHQKGCKRNPSKEKENTRNRRKGFYIKSPSETKKGYMEAGQLV